MQSARVLLDILVYSTTSALSPVPKVARLGPAGSLAASATAIDVSLAVMVAVRVVFGLLSMPGYIIDCAISRYHLLVIVQTP